MPAHAWIGLGVIGAAEAALVAGHGLAARWFTPIVWTGYVLFVDGHCFRSTGTSYLRVKKLPQKKGAFAR